MLLDAVQFGLEALLGVVERDRLRFVEFGLHRQRGHLLRQIGIVLGQATDEKKEFEESQFIIANNRKKEDGKE